MQNTANMSGASGQNFGGEKDADFKLEEKVSAESEGIRMLCKFKLSLINILSKYRTGFLAILC